MEKQMGAIIGKPNDYKICPNCGNVNFYEAEKCHFCENDTFNKQGEGVLKEIQNQYSEYIEEDGYTEAEIDLIETTVM